MNHKVAVVGMAGITALGDNWPGVAAGLKRLKNAVCYMPQWEEFRGLQTKVAAPIVSFDVPAYYTRRQLRSMSRVSLFATRATELSLEQAGLLHDPLLHSGELGIAYGSSAGSAQSVEEFGALLRRHDTHEIGTTTYVKMMPHTTAVNIGVFFGITGRIIPTSSACTSGSQAIGYAFECIKHGYQTVMVAGGAEELTVGDSAVFDLMYAASLRNDSPAQTPRPFDVKRDGLVIGEGAATLVLEEWEHARARGAPILAEVVGFATNSDGTHVTKPNEETIRRCLQLSLEGAGLPPEAIGYISAHGTATKLGDLAESRATYSIFGSHTPISSLKSYFGHSLGACGAIEAWLTLKMQEEGWFAPTLNLEQVDPKCGELDYIRGALRELQCEYVQSNNFAFGGVNTSLIFRRTR
ncbi:MAG: beta-ketoacyl-ACP synthase [Succinivibrio sp.]|nr:beta-ketoacyl-ACP synthase [Succinivibrio sp.]